MPQEVNSPSFRCHAFCAQESGARSQMPAAASRSSGPNFRHQELRGSALRRFMPFEGLSPEPTIAVLEPSIFAKPSADRSCGPMLV
jgi:hypothetical protein